MLKNWPQSNQDDLPRFVEYLESQLIEDEQIVRFEISNRSISTYISIEPIGTYDVLPFGSKCELVAIVKKNTADLTIETSKDHIIVYAMYAAAIFKDCVATMAYQD